MAASTDDELAPEQPHGERQLLRTVHVDQRALLNWTVSTIGGM